MKNRGLFPPYDELPWQTQQTETNGRTETRQFVHPSFVRSSLRWSSTHLYDMGGASGWQGEGRCPPVVVRKILCALSTLPVHCRSVNFM